MRKLLSMALVFILILSLLSGCGTSGETPATTTEEGGADAGSQEKVTLKIGYGIADTTTMGKAVQEWADKVNADTEGRIEFEIYPSGQLGTMTEIIEAVDLGQLDIALGDSSLMSETVPQLNLLSLPMLIKDYEGWKTLVESEVGDSLKDQVAENTNIVVLGWMFNGFREIITSKDVKSLEDCKDVIIRSPEADIYIQTLTKLNFTPTALSFSEVYTALQTGVVQACETSYEQFITNSFFEEAQHMIESNHMAATMSILVNKDIWEGISPEDQEIIMKNYEEIMGKCDDNINKEAETFKEQLMNEHGCTLYQYTDEEIQELDKRFEEYWSEDAAKNGYEDLLKKAMELRK